MPERSCFVLPDRAGNLEQLQLLEGSSMDAPVGGEVRVRIKAVGLNFADIFTGLGLYGPVMSGQVKGPFVPGLEFSGVVEEIGQGDPHPWDPTAEVVLQRGGQITELKPEVWAVAQEHAQGFRVGDRVFGCVRFGAYATYVNVPAHQIRHVPEGWSFEEAAAFPCQSITVLYALRHLGALESGHTVLIHSMAGGCGLQATAICLAHGATVVGTVGSESKVPMLLERFPKLKREQIVVRDRYNFGGQLAAALQAVGAEEGFDVVLDAVLGDFFQGGWDSLAPGGRYIVYGSADLTPTSASMGIWAWIRLAWQWLRRPRVDLMNLPPVNRSVMGFNLIHCFNKAPLLMKLLDELMAMKLPKPHIGLECKFGDALKAMRTFQSGQTVGKVVLKVDH